jgi:virginiamycin B lyase
LIRRREIVCSIMARLIAPTRIGKAGISLLGVLLASAFPIVALSQGTPPPKTNSGTTRGAPSIPAPAINPAAVPKFLEPAGKLFGPATEIELMTASQPSALALDPRDGAVWFAAPNLGAVGRIDIETRKVSYIHLGKRTKPGAIAFGPNNALFVTDKTFNVLHRIDGDTGDVTRIAMPAELPLLDLAGLRTDREGRIWFAGAAGWLGKFDPSTGGVEVSSHDDLQGLSLNAMSENGALWFVAWRAGRMIRIDPEKGRFDSTSLPESFRGARGISTGPQGEVWVSAAKTNAIARFAGRGTWKVITLPWPESQPQAILARRDGSVLVADGARRKLVRYVPSLDRFEEIADFGEGGIIKAMIETRNGIALADSGGDDISLLPELRPGEN